MKTSFVMLALLALVTVSAPLSVASGGVIMPPIDCIHSISYGGGGYYQHVNGLSVGSMTVTAGPFTYSTPPFGVGSSNWWIPPYGVSTPEICKTALLGGLAGSANVQLLA